ncbi:hypothetical protein MMPV_002855 [Pyropia vietnamensis]
MAPPVEPVQVLILGGGVAGAGVLKSLTAALRKAGVSPTDATVTLVDPKDYFEVPWPVPRALVDARTRDRLHASFSGFVAGPRRVGTVTEVSPESVVLSDGTRLPYDIAVVTTGANYAGSSVIQPVAGPASVQGRRAALDAVAASLAAASSVLVIGGGAVGVEVAAEVAAAAAPPPPGGAPVQTPRKTITLVHAGDRLVPQMPPRASAAVAARLTAAGVTVVLGERVAPRDDSPSVYESTLRPGTLYAADVTLRCTGVTPATDCLRAHFPGALDAKGNVVINAFGAVAGTADRLWAAGDAAITSDGASTKNGVWALAHAPVLGRNVAAAVVAAVERRATGLAPAEAPVYKPLRPPAGVMIVTLGPHAGVASTPLGVSRRLLPWIKNRDLFVAKTRAEIGAPPVEAEARGGAPGAATKTVPSATASAAAAAGGKTPAATDKKALLASKVVLPAGKAAVPVGKASVPAETAAETAKEVTAVVEETPAAAGKAAAPPQVADAPDKRAATPVGVSTAPAEVAAALPGETAPPDPDASLTDRLPLEAVAEPVEESTPRPDVPVEAVAPAAGTTTGGMVAAPVAAVETADAKPTAEPPGASEEPPVAERAPPVAPLEPQVAFKVHPSASGEAAVATDPPAADPTATRAGPAAGGGEATAAMVDPLMAVEEEAMADAKEPPASPNELPAGARQPAMAVAPPLVASETPTAAKQEPASSPAGPPAAAADSMAATVATPANDGVPVPGGADSG